MPYVNNNGVRIHYKIEGEGPPLVLHHWSFGTLEDWYDYGYVDGLRDRYQLIMLDSRGNGGSDKLHNPEDYEFELRVSDVVAVLNDLYIFNTHFFGYSLGGWIGYGMVRYASERLRSVIIAGQHPYEQKIFELRKIARYAIDYGTEAFIAMWEKDIGALSFHQKDRMRTYDFKALLTMAQDRDSLEDVLPMMIMPALLIVGDNDEVYPLARKGFEQIPECKFVTLSGVDHFEGFRRSDLMVPQIIEFIEGLNLSKL